jgi:hypothetical protein
MNRRTAFIAVLVVVALGLVWWLPRHRSAGPAGAGPLSGPAASAGPAAPANAAGAPASAYANEEPSHLADRLNTPGADINSDLRVLNDIFVQFRSATHGGNPIGENSEITAALTGRNRLDFAFIPRNHPAINARGELCDRWGNPFFFHQLSGTQMEIRSAGPDGKLWTDDDRVLTPGLRAPPL